MSGTRPGSGQARMERTARRRGGAFEHAPGILAIAAAVALWAAFAAGVAAPLGDALSRIDARERAAPPACAPPEDAVASAVERSAGSCP